jgi:hypothetical protein
MRPRSIGVLGLSALLGIGAFVGMVILGARMPEAVLVTLAASVAAALTVILVVERPVAACGLLFALASISAVFVDLPIGRVRLEQPAILAAIITLVVSRSWPRRSEIRPMLPIVASFAVYLVVLTVASALNAPKPLVSARMIILTALSMAGGMAVFALLVRPGRMRAEAWFTATGVGHALIGLVIAGAFLIIGPTGIPGMQANPGQAPKVAGLAFEANLFASMLGAIAPFALDRFRTRPVLATAIPVIVIVIGVGLGVTRGAYLGLGAGLLVYLGVLAYRSRRPSQVLAIAPVIAVALLLAPSVAAIALPTERSSPQPTERSSTLPTERSSPPVTGTPGPGESGSTRASASAAVTSPIPSPVPTPDTFAYRINVIPSALSDLRTSPFIGLGAASYGQRHALPDQPGGTSDYINILALAAVYESGLAGASALALGFALSLWLLFRLSRDRPGPAAAYAASIVSLLVAYEATNALFFSINWIILGAGLALAVQAMELAVTE